MTREWTLEAADKTYGISQWGLGYFEATPTGGMAVLPTKDPNGPRIDFKNIIQEIKNQNIQLPTVVRFHDILRNQVKTLNQKFVAAIKESSYQGKYCGVFPIKVNQLREVVEEVLDAGEEFNFGLEAGSKAEILVALSENTNPKSLTILNGYKDKEYLELALLGRKLGRKVFVVIERYSELVDLIALAKKWQIDPLIGIRSKLSATGAGKWKDSSGENAKFGLSTTEIVKAINLLQEENLLHTFKLFHFHIGSQVPDLKTIKDALNEGTRIYAKLIQMGANIEYFDLGGGLAVDYDGSRSTFQSSRNYKNRDYVEDVVWTLKEICDLENVPHPNIITESGRALSAHHSCIIVNVFGRTQKAEGHIPAITKDEHHLVKQMRGIFDDIDIHNIQLAYNDANGKKDEVLNAFKLGYLHLEDRSKAEQIYWSICHKVLNLAEAKEYPPEDLMELRNIMADQYLCNFSVFQSTPDVWAIQQLLPIVPLTRLNEYPDCRGILVDITCDSDGKIDRFIDFDDVKTTLPLHCINDGEEYHLGIFLTGAYQDIMGDNHNLFGRLNEIHIYCDDDDPEDFYIEETIKGNRAGDILKSLQYTPEEMAKKVKRELDRQAHKGHIKPKESVRLTDLFENALESYTYLNHQ